ncbi:hypothetical protein, partial [Myxacorys almedinensis]|uniref:hypothetical protein n=1 Tax=Myxacorys almedinensis TaxID=2651157 RepID=UPI001EE3CEB7
GHEILAFSAYWVCPFLVQFLSRTQVNRTKRAKLFELTSWRQFEELLQVKWRQTFNPTCYA